MNSKYCLKGHDKDLTGRVKVNSCLLCQRMATQKWRLANPDKVKFFNTKSKLKRKEKDKSQKRNRQLLAKFGISLNEYNDKLKAQKGLCEICKLSERSFNKSLSVDHDHRTGQIRGLLCNNCNSRIIYTLENFAHLLPIAQEYLKIYASI